MADSKTKTLETESQTDKNSDNPGDNVMYGTLNDEMYDCVKGVSHLLLQARLQANEADIRARFAKQFAERSVAEAKSAHQVSEALARTARVIATIALEFANKTDLMLDSKAAVLNSADSAHDVFTNEYVGDHMNKYDTEKTRTRSLPRRSPGMSLEERHRTLFPNDISGDRCELIKQTSPKLPPVLENSSLEEEMYSGSDETEINSRIKQAKFDIQRKMQLYKDSKIMKKSLGTGDAQFEPLYGHGVQTTLPIGQAEEIGLV